MCEECRNEILTEEEIETEENLDEMNTIPPIIIPMETYDKERFFKGLDDYTYLAGAIVAIANTGIDPSAVLEYFLNKDILENNLKMAEISKSMSIEVSKNTQVNLDKNQL